VVTKLALGGQSLFVLALLVMSVRTGPMQGAAGTNGLDRLVGLLGQIDDAGAQADILRGMNDALNGRREVPMPAAWPAVYHRLGQSPNAEVRAKAQLLAVLFGDADALASLRQVVQDRKAPTAGRQSALQALLSRRSPDLVSVLQGLLADPAMRGPALRGLAAFADASTPGLILRLYPSLGEDEKTDAIQTLASRPAFALALLDAVDKGQIARRDLSAFTVRQIQALKDKQVNEKLTRVWGTIRPASQEKADLMTKYRNLLTPAVLKEAAPANGRLLFTKTCAACHVLFGEGGKIGPELTGAQRTNLDYLLENLIDPSALVGRDYLVTQMETRYGRLITGIIKEETDQVVTVQTQNELLRLPKTDIAERVQSPLSMMPERLLDSLKDEEVRDLIAYLGSPAQVPLPAANKPNQP
jgi:putative heme-binding domain-containing protein